MTCISPSGWCSRWSLGKNLCADHREALGEAGIPPTKWALPAQGARVDTPLVGAGAVDAAVPGAGAADLGELFFEGLTGTVNADGGVAGFDAGCLGEGVE